ncbi:hypothetical protein ACFWNN_41895 [Lentzea sp. NPDC058450]|uniref:hypothetical protein n=1 Tax=Lentzea sp. NPDC058450 TaxID=3346505 RepID=UPI0036693D51
MTSGHEARERTITEASRLPEVDEAAADLRDLVHVLARSAADSGRRTSFDDVLAAFGHTRESLAAVKDDDLLAT